MDPRKLFFDERNAALCVFCGDPPATREHVVLRVLLDDPLPDDLPLVGSCQRCNNGFSKDEEYLACLVECVICGSAESDAVTRPKVRAGLLHSPALAARIAACRADDASGMTIWKPDEGRVRNVIIKLARGHVAHQHSVPQLDDATDVMVTPMMTMTAEERDNFEAVPQSLGWPEIGSRAFVNLIVAGDRTYDLESGWNILQAGRYRYLVAEPGEIVVRIVLSEYLAAEVVW
jgi:hypothetical protein